MKNLTSEMLHGTYLLSDLRTEAISSFEIYIIQYTPMFLSLKNNF